ncbi:MAG: transcriptional regulator [Deltaproteobacteria bacterium]|nr:MAG: transcriptional regulator [Deltaproteobacteria bacterium]
MPVYEYECKSCQKVFEVQQKMTEAPLAACPQCDGAVTKLMSMNSFQLKGGGWYADGYSKASKAPQTCKPEGGCAGCPASSSGSA